jgi:hypothetical protein
MHLWIRVKSVMKNLVFGKSIKTTGVPSKCLNVQIVKLSTHVQ